MKSNIIKIYNSDESLFNQAIKESVDILNSGGIVIHPTDTCYGIAADITNMSAIEKVYKFKGRNYDKPLSVIVHSFNEFKKYGAWHPLAGELAAEKPHQQYTFVVKRRKSLPRHLNPQIDTIGIQIPKHRFSLALLEKIEVPLTATSANISGMPNNYSVDEFLSQLEDAEIYPDLIIDGGKLPRREPSRVVEIIGSSFKILR